MPDPNPLLAMEGIDKRFGAVQALSDVSFEVFPGEVVALVGDNGAGKSTLVKIISGAYRADAGVTRWEGQDVEVHGPHDAAGLGIATVYQDLALCENLDVVANLYLGHERLAAGVGQTARWLDEAEMERESVTLLTSLAAKIPSVRTPVAALSGGQRQTVAIARALLGAPKMVLLDEPTAALGVSQTHQVLELIHRLRERGLGVVVISHNLADVFEVADRIVVLHLGRRSATFQATEASREDVVAAITGADQAGRADNGPEVAP